MAFLDDDPVSRRRRGYDKSFDVAQGDSFYPKPDEYLLRRGEGRPMLSREGAGRQKTFIEKAVDRIINGIGIRESATGKRPWE